ncbi:hypothetical protein [Candidatus Tisiphia endosymbiont of Myopa tessellatipennis]|uniref:hypothetical protein n=1 Tax=Candidatus Tisiphia endosymbiont of Myopa tessellatipennis TaxID=3066257 RepID=UPI00313F3686
MTKQEKIREKKEEILQKKDEIQQKADDIITKIDHIFDDPNKFSNSKERKEVKQHIISALTSAFYFYKESSARKIYEVSLQEILNTSPELKPVIADIAELVLQECPDNMLEERKFWLEDVNKEILQGIFKDELIAIKEIVDPLIKVANSNNIAKTIGQDNAKELQKHVKLMAEQFNKDNIKGVEGTLINISEWSNQKQQELENQLKLEQKQEKEIEQTIIGQKKESQRLKQLAFAKFGTTIKSALAFISDVITNKDANESKKTFKDNMNELLGVRNNSKLIDKDIDEKLKLRQKIKRNINLDQESSKLFSKFSKMVKVSSSTIDDLKPSIIAHPQTKGKNNSAQR